MSIAVARKQTSFRLRTDLLEMLQKAATRENRSLNNYVESVLLDSVYNTPNAETLAAMQEVEKGIGLRKADTSNLDAFIKSCEE